VTTAGGDYPVVLASNASWAAAVSAEGDGWCTVTPTSGTGRSALTITVAESTLEAPDRSATVTITSGTLTQTVDVRQMFMPTPTYAASTQTWTFGASTLVWSDAIQIPGCNKDTYANSDTEPQCRSYTSGTNTWYYYNWPYVNQHAAQLCPTPWRVPATSDWEALIVAADPSTLTYEWELGGYANLSSVTSIYNVAYMWSSTEYSSTYAYRGYYYAGSLGVDHTPKFYGFQVRCVQ
jgi:hypothetical protein